MEKIVKMSFERQILQEMGKWTEGIVKTENEKRCFVMKVQAFCEEKGLRSFLGVFGYAESKNQCWQAEKWLLYHLICIFPRWSPKLRKNINCCKLVFV